MERTEEEFQDITLVCKETGVEFVWTAGEQKFFKERGLTNPPKVSPEVRAKRKAERAAQGGNSFNNYNRRDNNE